MPWQLLMDIRLGLGAPVNLQQHTGQIVAATISQGAVAINFL